MLNTPRIEPVDTPKIKESIKKAMRFFNRNGKSPEYPGNLFGTLFNHPALTLKWFTFAHHILFKSTLSARDQEIIILRTGWLCQSEYEWSHHSILAKNAGLSDIEIEKIKDGPLAGGWSRYDAYLLKAVDELKLNAFINDNTWNELSKHLSTKQMMDLVFTIGQYNLVSMALNSFGVQLDEGLRDA